MWAYAVTIFLGAFLLFQVQPLIGKYILPWFGGGPGVWTTCMLFFQMVLLAGYAYAHFSTRWLRTRNQIILHGGLLLAAVCLLPIVPSDAWKPQVPGNPVPQILWLLTVSLGLPYFVLSATGPLIQQWFSRAQPGVSPYRLYALSNVGSLLALLSYPFFFENHFTRAGQARLWAGGLGLYVVACSVCAWKLWQANPANAHSPANEPKPKAKGKPADEPSTPFVSRLLWLLLPACASVLLLATTNKLCQDIAVMPFLWVLPLALYLVTFIISFDSPRWYQRGFFAVAMVLALGAVCWALFLETDLALRWQVLIYGGMLFVCCMVCHGELYRLRPAPQHLTGFYLMIALGGALGGLFVAVIAPLIFLDHYELHWGLLLCGLLFLAVCLSAKSSGGPTGWRPLAIVLTLLTFIGLDVGLVALHATYPEVVGDRYWPMRLAWWAVAGGLVVLWIARKRYQTFQHWRVLTCFWLGVGLVALGIGLWFQAQDFAGRILTRSRNFYGTLRVAEYRTEEPDAHYYLLEHGRITHGLQFANPQFAQWPTTYYGGSNGLALALGALPAGPRRVGVVGLGAGTTAAYGRTGDTFRLYEINPEVIRLAHSRFTYLSNSAAKIELVLGDARLSLEHESPQNFDLLTLDAFSSDSIPVHLLTKEAFEVYARHLNTNGVIAVHISNRYLNLKPVLANVAKAFNYQMATIEFEEDDEFEEDPQWWVYSSTWVLLTHNEAVMNNPGIRLASSSAAQKDPVIPLWTDDFASVFQIFE